MLSGLLMSRTKVMKLKITTNTCPTFSLVVIQTFTRQIDNTPIHHCDCLTESPRGAHTMPTSHWNLYRTMEVAKFKNVGNVVQSWKVTKIFNICSVRIQCYILLLLKWALFDLLVWFIWVLMQIYFCLTSTLKSRGVKSTLANHCKQTSQKFLPKLDKLKHVVLIV